MPKIFTTLDKIKPAYDVTYKVVLFICKLLGGYVSPITNPLGPVFIH